MTSADDPHPPSDPSVLTRLRTALASPWRRSRKASGGKRSTSAPPPADRRPRRASGDADEVDMAASVGALVPVAAEPAPPRVSPETRAALESLRDALNGVLLVQPAKPTEEPGLGLPASAAVATTALELHALPAATDLDAAPSGVVADIVAEHVEYLYTAVSSVRGSASLLLPPGALDDDPSASPAARLWSLLGHLLAQAVQTADSPHVAVAFLVAYLRLLAAGLHLRAAEMHRQLAALDLAKRQEEVAAVQAAASAVARDAQDVAASLAACASATSSEGESETAWSAALRQAADVVPRLVAVHDQVDACTAAVDREIRDTEARRSALKMYAAAGLGVAALASGGALLAAGMLGSAATSATAMAAIAAADGTAMAGGALTAAKAGSSVSALTLTTVAAVTGVSAAVTGTLGPHVEAAVVGPTEKVLRSMHLWRTQLFVSRMTTKRAAWELAVVIDRILETA
ncbi:hypothetical protein H9P43_004690 [Blastocladiella emersonii ATCC 22665]|nr:hypothetical protein H9P43_004690 [Blastocladiella emersonii ATCC 22665]